MSTAIDNEQIDKAKAKELISSIKLIPEVESIDVELYTDHTGDPSLQLIFWLRKDTTSNPAFSTQLLEFTQEVQFKILRSDLNRFPYTRLKQAA